MKVKTLKSFAIATLGVVLGIGVVVGLSNKIGVQQLRSSQADASRSYTITAAMLQDAQENHGGVFQIGEYDTFKSEKVTFETAGGKLYAVLKNDGGKIYSTSAAGENIKNLRRGTGYTGITFYNKDCNIDARITFNDNDGKFVSINAESGASKYTAFPNNLGIGELNKIKLVTFGDPNEHAFKFTSFELHYSCEDTVPALTISAASTLAVGNQLAITKTFKYTGDTTPNVTYHQSSEDGGEVTINGETVTGKTAGTVNLYATFDYADYHDVASNVITFTVADNIINKSISFKSTSNLGGNVVYLTLDNTEMELGDSDEALIEEWSMEFLDDTGLYGNYEAGGPAALSKNNDSEWNFYDANASEIKLTVNLSAGFPDNQNFTHKFTFKIVKGNTVYRGYVVIWGNKSVINNNGTITPILMLSANAQSLEKGETLTVSKQFAGVAENEVENLAFVSSDNSIATVNANGVVTGAAAGNVTISATFDYEGNHYTSKKNVSLLITDSSAQVTYFAWSTAEDGPLYIQGAGMILAVDFTKIGYASAQEANAVLGSVNVVVTGKSCSKVEFQQPGFAKAPGLYVTFPDADYSQITKITVTMPGKAGTQYAGTTYTAELELTFNGSNYTITKMNGAAV